MSAVTHSQSILSEHMMTWLGAWQEPDRGPHQVSDSIHEARMQFCGPHQARLLVAPAAMIPPRVTTAALTWTVMVHVTSPEPVCLDARPNKQYYKTVAAFHWSGPQHWRPR